MYRNLKKTVLRVLDQADELENVVSVSIPTISCGIYGFPTRRCAGITIKACVEWLQLNSDSTKVRYIRLVNSDRGVCEAYEEKLHYFYKRNYVTWLN
jgi:O-acetyl-ADP-ribose deacetylase